MHTVCLDFVRIMPYVRSLQAYETYEIATYRNIRQSWGIVAPPHVQASSRRATGIHNHAVTALSHHHDALWTSKPDNDYIDTVMTTLVTHESSYKETHSRHACLHPYTRSHTHTALSNMRVFGNDVNLSLDNICSFVHDVEPPCWFTGRACGCRAGPC